MYDYNKLFLDFLQYKHYLGYKYKTDEIVLKEIVKYLTENNIDIITKDVIEDYARLNSNLNSNTIARNMGVFKEFCKYLSLQEINCYQIPNKIYSQNHHNYTPYIFSHKEIKQIYQNLDKPLNNYHYDYYKKVIYPLIIKILYQTGMRIGEVLNLTIEDYKGGYFHLIDTKNDEERFVILSDKLNELIKNYIHKFNYKFMDNNKLFQTCESTILKYFNKVLKLSNITKTDKGPRLHDLRHTFVVHIIEKWIKEKSDVDVLLPILQTHMGHKSLEALSYYFHLNHDLRHVVNKVSEETMGYLIPRLEDNYE